MCTRLSNFLCQTDNTAEAYYRQHDYQTVIQDQVNILRMSSEGTPRPTSSAKKRTRRSDEIDVPTPAKQVKGASTARKALFQEDTVNRDIDVMALEIAGQIRDENNGTLVGSSIASPADIRRRMPEADTASSMKTVRRIRHHKEKDENIALATMMLPKQAREKRVAVEKLTKIREIDTNDATFRKCVDEVPSQEGDAAQRKGLFAGRIKAVMQQMKEVFTSYQVSKTSVTEEEIAEAIRTQNWPHCTECTDPVKGRTLKNSTTKVKKGTIICDYHGNHMSQEGRFANPQWHRRR